MQTTSIDIGDFRVREDEKIKLDERLTEIAPIYRAKEDYEEILARHVRELASRQAMLYAQSRRALLLIFQAMDAAGKDGAIKHVMSGVNPQGCQVYSFKRPSAAELAHDFLWRAALCLPERGRIGIFNRSYYEEVLIVRVHPELLAAEGLPEDVAGDGGDGGNGRDGGNGDIWKRRLRSIRDWERHLAHEGTRIVKFFLHLSREEQKKRFIARIDEPDKNWKLGMADVEERKYWPQYMKAYEACLGATSSRHAPWYIVPADDKPNARLIISQIVLEEMAALKLAYPRATAGHRKELAAIRERLETEDDS